MKFIVIRHGETPWNKKSKLQGREANRPYFNELNSKGKKQAKLLAKRIKLDGQHIDLIISSPLRRAKGTAKILSKKLEIKEVIYDDRLKDRGYGPFSGKTRETFGGNKFSYQDFWDYNKNVQYNNGAENIKEFEARIRKFIEECKIKYPNKTILLVMHVSGTKMINCLIGSGIPENGIISGNGLNNGEIAEYVLEVKSQREEFISGLHSNSNNKTGGNYEKTIKKYRNRDKQH